MEQKPILPLQGSDDIARSSRDAPPAHYTLKINSFSRLLEILSETESENYESDIFEASGYKWKLSLYPNGDTERNGEGHISLYLVIAETDSLPVGWEIKVNFKLFVFDQIRGTYSMFQEDNNGKLHNFHESKTEFGFAKLLPLMVFKTPSNGFLTSDKCVFGVEVFVLNYSGRRECLSAEQKVGATHTWRIDNLSSIQKDMLCSDEFTLGNRTWVMQIYPKGDTRSKGEYLSLYLKLNDFQMKGKAYVNYRLKIRDQLHRIRMETAGNQWFEQTGWGSSTFLNLRNFYDDPLIFEVVIESISCANKLISQVS